MNDIIDNFVNTAKDNYQSRIEPGMLSKFFGNSSDLESAPPVNMQSNTTTQNSQTSGWGSVKAKLPFM